MKTPPHLLNYARQLRQNQTDAEQLIWYLIRNKRLKNAKFRRQHPIENYILDFYCHSQKLAIELDGSQHFEPEGQQADDQRDAKLNQLGIKVIRFNNLEALTDTEAVLTTIWNTLND